MVVKGKLVVRLTEGRRALTWDGAFRNAAAAER